METAEERTRSAADLLRELYFFRGLTQDDLLRVAAVCREESHDQGEVICREGTPADRFFIIISGCVEVWKDHGAREADLLAVHGPGHLFGELALIDELPRSATVVAREPTRLLSVVREDFQRIVRENASVALTIMRSVSSMVRASNDSFVESLRNRNRALVRANRELKSAQARLIRAERLSLLGRMSSLIIHDIRNPLAVLRGLAEMILFHPTDPAGVERNIRRVIDEADRLGRIAGELLDYSRGEISLHMSIVNPRDLVSEAEGILREPFAARGIEIRTLVTADQPVIADHDRLLRVLLNLADNSRKAMPSGGVFTIAVSRQDRTLVFEVSDTGEGMDEEVQDRLFEPFFTSSKEGGTGLGMSIVKSIVDAHEGSLSFTSRRHEGTTFKISLPLQG
jgi:signal transduction histidine kinase